MLAWYPLSRIMLHLCTLVTVGLVVLGVIVGYGTDIVGEVVDSFVKVIGQQNPSYQPDARSIAQMKVFFAHALPAVQGAVWVVILFACFYVAAALVRISGRGKRPRDDVPAALRMPRAALGFFAIGLVLAFLGGVPAFIGSAVCGAFAARLHAGRLRRRASSHAREVLALRRPLARLCRGDPVHPAARRLLLRRTARNRGGAPRQAGRPA